MDLKEEIELTHRQKPCAKMIRYKTLLFILIICTPLLMADAMAASSLTIGEGYMNYGGTKDVYTFPDKNSDIFAALAVGAPCDILSISGDWIVHRNAGLFHWMGNS